jgi:hypothetical protein
MGHQRTHAPQQSVARPARPRVQANGELGVKIIERVDRLSRPYGVHLQNRDGIRVVTPRPWTKKPPVRRHYGPPAQRPISRWGVAKR